MVQIFVWILETCPATGLSYLFTPPDLRVA